MKLKLKSKGLLPRLLLYNSLLVLLVCSLLYFFGTAWNRLDYQALDFLYRYNIDDPEFIRKSDDVILLNVTSESYKYFGSNILKRESLAEVNNVLAELAPAAVMYDVIFLAEGEDEGDRLFEESLKNLEKIYLPVGIEPSSAPVNFRKGNGDFYQKLNTDYNFRPKEVNEGSPFRGARALVQLDRFSTLSSGSGHLTVVADADGVFRHIPLLIRIDSTLFPSISLTMFLDYLDVPLDSVIVNWGESITIKSGLSRYVDKDIVIPIDVQGQTYIPYPSYWSDFPRMMDAHNLIKYYQDPDMQGDLLSYYEGKFVLIGDVSEGISDLGQTQLEDNVPLVLIHASVLNAFLNDGFFSKTPEMLVFFILLVAGFLFTASSLLKSNIPFYSLGILSVIVLFAVTNHFFTAHHLIPVATLFIGITTTFLGTLIILQILSNQEQVFIKNAFSKYVPEKVVDKLIDNPSQLQLGGEERLVTILFSDIKDFTKISEDISPAMLGRLINGYLTEMTRIVLEQGGIIDKYIGDGILAEFGVPLFTDDHAEKALRAALKMQQQLPHLNERWQAEGLSTVSVRIGINTGHVIAGNMGSEQVFDYTVLGDPVNLASRLEGANKLYGSKILISEFTLAYINKNDYIIRPLDKLTVKGKSQAVLVYEVIGYASEKIPAKDQEYYNLYTEAFNLFIQGDHTGSEKLLRQILSGRDDDPAALNLLKKLNLT
ncbi:MAG: adenylate/guanylate cyclase domain-containing protein [Ignavibacteriaceae bacterium]|nr:adenylate/guanylate cyclase domain-containing protein [Ignavibacteriaceae bacterium]